MTSNFFNQNLHQVFMLKKLHIFFIIGPRGLECENNLLENIACESFKRVGLTLEPCFKVNGFFIQTYFAHYWS